MRAALVLLSLVFLYGMSGCEGDTSVGVGAGGTAIIDTKDGIVQVHDGTASQCGTNGCSQTPIACPLLNSAGEVICSCDSFFAGEC